MLRCDGPGQRFLFLSDGEGAGEGEGGGRYGLGKMGSRTEDCAQLSCGANEAYFLVTVEGVEGRRGRVEVGGEGGVHVRGVYGRGAEQQVRRKRTFG